MPYWTNVLVLLALSIALTHSVYGGSDSESEETPKDWLQKGHSYSGYNSYNPPVSQPWLDSSSYTSQDQFNDGEGSDTGYTSDSDELVFSQIQEYLRKKGFNDLKRNTQKVMKQAKESGENVWVVAEARVVSREPRGRVVTNAEKKELSKKYKAEKKARGW